ncbi:MAG: hypothetical protein JWM84_3402 [Nocardioides sp.]|nr:hypothetical protein [Nocardioides sp.]
MISEPPVCRTVRTELYRGRRDHGPDRPIPALNVVKISFPRPVSHGSLRERDMHAGHHHVPLALPCVPGTDGARG